MLEFSTSRHPKARSIYRCDLCGRVIAKGEKYHRYSGKYEGSMFDLKYCMDCELIIDEYGSETGCSEYDDWDIRDWLADKFCHKCCHGAGDQDDCEVSEIQCPFILNELKKGR